MSTLPPMNIRYPYDPTGRDPGNLVVGEVHELPPVNNRIIVPRLGAFYAKSLIIHHNGNRLTLGKDYELAALYHDATVATGQDVNIMIYFNNLELDGEFVLEYQVVGGQFTGVWEAVQQYVNVLLVDPRKVKWDDILHKPELYAPMDHFHDINDIYGLNYLVPKMEEIRQAVLRVRSKEMRKVWDRIFKIKKDAEDLIERSNQELIERVKNESNNQEAIDRLKEQIKALDVRVSVLENLDGIQEELEHLRQEDAKLNTRINSVNTSIDNILNVELPNKVDVKTFKSELDNIRKSYLPVINGLLVDTVLTSDGTYAGYGSVSVNKLKREGFNLSLSKTKHDQDYVILSLTNPATGCWQHTQFISLGYTEHYIRSSDYDAATDSSSINGYYTERLVTDKNINEIVEVSKSPGNIIQMKGDGLYATSNGLSFETISALPEKKWSEGVSFLARDKDGNFFRMGVEQELIQDLGVAITVDNAIKSFVTGSTVTYNVKITLTNSGNGLVENGDLIITLPKQDESTPYSIANVKHVLSKAVSKTSTLELTQLTKIQPGGTCVITFDLTTSSKGSFQIGAQTVTNGQVDSNTVNNHASITLYSSETVVIDNGNIDTNYKFTADCPMIIPTVVEAPEGFENYVGKQLRMFPTVNKDSGIFTKSVSDFTDYREYVECFNHLPRGRWKIKLENCSSFVVNRLYIGNYLKIDSRVENNYDTYIAGNYDNVDVSGNFANTLTTVNGGSIDWDPSGIVTLNIGDNILTVYCRPKGSNCVWQCIRFSASYLYTLPNRDDLIWRNINLYSISGNKFILPNKEVIGTNFNSSENVNNNPGIDTKLKPNGVIMVKNQFTGLTSKIRYSTKIVEEYIDSNVVNDTSISMFFNYLKINPIAYMHITSSVTQNISYYNTFTIKPYGDSNAIRLSGYPNNGRVYDSYKLVPGNIFSRFSKIIKRSLELTVDSFDEDVWYMVSNVGEYNTRNGNITAVVNGTTYRFRLYNGVSSTDNIMVNTSNGLSINIP